MFQTDINHYLQSFSTEGLTTFMQFVTALGYPTFLMFLMIILLLAFDFKKAFILVQILLWTGVFTLFFKEYFNLPRPFHVDNTLQFLDGELPDDTVFQFSERGATSFWGGLPSDVLEVTRQSNDLENGFPSGHTSGALALWGAIAILFRKKWLRLLSLILIVLIPISRIYLGVHFLADVIGGIVVGAIGLAVSYAIILKPDKLSEYLQKDKYAIGFNTLTVFMVLCPLLFIPLIPEKYYVLIAHMLGIGLAFLLLANKGLPNSAAPWKHRIGRTLVGLMIFIVFRYLLTSVAEQVGINENIWIDFSINFLGSLALIWLGTRISLHLGWFKSHDWKNIT